MSNLAQPDAPAGLRLRLERLTAETPARWGRMSAPQMICHLTDSFLACMGEKPISDATGLFERTVMKWGALYLPFPWPKGVPTRPEVEQGVGGTPPTDFERDRAELLRTMDRFLTFDLSESRHPIFGAMTRGEWMRWGWLHVDHHLRQFGL